MREYIIAWLAKDNEDVYQHNERREPIWYRVWRLDGKTEESITPPMTRKEAEEKLRMIQLLDPPAQKELDLWQ
jgi:hypothetical protein